MSKNTIGSVIRAILSRKLVAGMAIAGAAAAANGATVVGQAQVTEHFKAPAFHYDLVNLGPREEDRADYVRIRDQAEQALHGKQRDLVRYFDLKRQLDRFPLEQKWVEDISNLVATVGKNDLLTNYFKGSSYTAAFYVGLVDNASFSAYNAADTMSSHAGWLESVAYSNSTRPALTLGTAASGSLDNSASKASFTINTSATLDGAFITTNSTKSGTTGTLYSCGAFSGGDRTVSNGDTLQVQATLTV
jgi:hypothetical protein